MECNGWARYQTGDLKCGVQWLGKIPDRRFEVWNAVARQDTRTGDLKCGLQWLSKILDRRFEVWSAVAMQDTS